MKKILLILFLFCTSFAFGQSGAGQTLSAFNIWLKNVIYSLDGDTLIAPFSDSTYRFMNVRTAVDSFDAVNFQQLIDSTRIDSLGNLRNVNIGSAVPDDLLGFNGLNWVPKKGVTVSGSSGIEFFMEDVEIIPTGNDNDNLVQTLMKVPTGGAEEVDDISVTNNTVYSTMYYYETGLGGSIIDAGVWTFNTYAAVNSVVGGRVSSILRNIYIAETGAGTGEVTGSGTSRTFTASGGTPFVAGDANADQTLAGYVQTPLGLYQITGYSNSTTVEITTPTTYSNESGVAFFVHKYQFGVNTGTITATGTNYTLYAVQTVQSEISINESDRISEIVFGISNNNTTVTYTHNGTEHYSHFETPLATRHDDLPDIHLAASGQPYGHIDDQAQTIAGIKTFTNHLRALDSLRVVGKSLFKDDVRIDGGILRLLTAPGANIATLGSATYGSLDLFDVGGALDVRITTLDNEDSWINNNGDFSLGTQNGFSKLTSIQNTSGTMPTLNSVPGGSAWFSAGSNSAGLSIGATATDTVWLQAREFSGSGNSDILALNPLGGEIVAGGKFIAQDSLRVIGASLFKDDVTINGLITATSGQFTGSVTISTIANSTGDFLTAPTNGGLVTQRTAAQVLSDIGGQSELTFGILNTNSVIINSTTVNDDEYARFTASGLESKTFDEVRDDLNVADGAEVNVNADWDSSSGDSEILNKPTLVTSLSDLSDVPSATNTNRFALMANGTTGYVGRAIVEADISDLGTYKLRNDSTANSGYATQFDLGSYTTTTSLNTLLGAKADTADVAMLATNNEFAKKIVINDSLRVNLTSLFKGNVTVNGKIVGLDSLRIDGFTLLKDDITVNGHISITGTGNSIFIGEGAGIVDDLTNNRNIFIGKNSGATNTTGSNNIGLGENTLFENIVGYTNTAIGFNALTKSTGNNNTVVGMQALQWLITGANNTAIGHNAGLYYTGTNNLTEATNSVFIGKGTDAKANSETNQIVIGHDAIGNGSNTVTLGDDNVTDVYMNEDGTAIVHGGNFISTVAIGTQPYAATSTTVNANLNADLLDGQHGSFYDNSGLDLDDVTTNDPSTTNDIEIGSASTKDGTSIINTAELQNSLAGGYYRFNGTNSKINGVANAKLNFGNGSDIMLVYRFRSNLEVGVSSHYVGGLFIDSDNSILFRYPGQSGSSVPSIRTEFAGAFTNIVINEITCDTEWNSIIITCSGSTYKTYLNGILVATDSGRDIGNCDNVNGYAKLGESGGSYYNGDISYFQIWNYIPSDEKIAKIALWDSNNPPINFADIKASQVEQTSGTLNIGERYRINDWITDDDFTNVGGTNVDGSEFIATGTTPTTWTNSSTVVRIGNILNLNESGITDATWYDNSGNDLNGTVSGATAIRAETTGFNNIILDGDLTATNGTLDSLLVNNNIGVNVIWADSVHTNWLGGSNTKIGESGFKLTVDMDSVLLTTEQPIKGGSFAIVTANVIYDAGYSTNTDLDAKSDTADVAMLATNNEFAKKIVINDSLRVEQTSLFKDNIFISGADLYIFDEGNNRAHIGVGGELSLFDATDAIGVRFDARDGQDNFINNGGGFAIGNQSSISKLDVRDNVNDTMPSLFSVPDGSGWFTARLNTAGLSIGVTVSDSVWLQAREQTGTGVSHILALNPLGGEIVAGGKFIAQDSLRVIGASLFKDDITVNGKAVVSDSLRIDGLLIQSTQSGITASTTQAQGQQPLTKNVNEIDVCANGNDVITLPPAQAGLIIYVIHNGAQTLQIFPASGDDLGAGVNNSETLAAGNRRTYIAYDNTNWDG